MAAKFLSLENIGKFIATQTLGVFLVVFYVPYVAPQERKEANDRISRQEKNMEDLVAVVRDLKAAVDPEKRPPLSRPQALFILDTVTELFQSQLSADLDKIKNKPATRAPPKPAAGKGAKPEVVPVGRLEASGDVTRLSFFFGEEFPPKLEKGAKPEVVIGGKIDEIRERLNKNLVTLQNGYQSQLKLSAKSAQTLKQELRVLSWEHGTLEEVWGGAFVRNYKHLEEDLVQCLEREMAEENSAEWDELRAFLRKHDLYESIKDHFPKDVPGQKDPCVALNDFVIHMHDDCDKLLKGVAAAPRRPLSGPQTDGAESETGLQVTRRASRTVQRTRRQHLSRSCSVPGAMLSRPFRRL